jgi:cell wall-associated NlpC family hydrolase
MSSRVRNIQCVVWVAIASFAVMKLDQRAHDGSSRALPGVALSGLADTRQQTVLTPRVRLASAEPFRGFEITEAMRDSIVRVARAQVGKRYRFGGTTPSKGFDCSGLVRYVLGQLHMPLPRLAAQQARVGEPIDRASLRPGDLLSFGGRDTVSHIGIYIGDGKYVHASSVAGRVIVSRLDRSPHRLIKPMRGARRLLALAETPLMSF